MNSIIDEFINSMSECKTLTCVQKYYKGKKIEAYGLVDASGNLEYIRADTLKEKIELNRIKVTNMTLTSDGRLIVKGSNNIKIHNTAKGYKCTKAPKQELASASSIVNSSNNYIIQQIDAANGILIMNNKSLNRDLIVNKAINNKIGILGLSAGSTIETSFVTNDYLANYNRLQNIFYVIHKELWKSCIDSKLTEKVLNYSKSLIGLRNNKLCYFCDFLELYIGEPIFLVIEPIEIGNNSYVFDCEYTCNEFTVHKRLNSVQNIVDIYRKLYNKYREI